MIIKEGTIIYDKEKTIYKIVDFIGSGGFGSVFKLKKESDKSLWALKTISESYQNEKLLKGLINEGNLAVKISHPNLIKYLFFHDGSLFSELPPYIIMEYANQGTLRQVLKKQLIKKEFLPTPELRKYFDELINGMEAINTELIHRDIKPENILIKDNVLKISDFGLSKIAEEQTRTSTFKGFGTPDYVAPECWKNEKNTIQMDIYSMGVVFFELATLTHPLKVTDKSDVQEWREAHLFQNPQKPEKINPNISPIYLQIILKMLEKSLHKRFKNWNEIRIALAKESMPQTKNTALVDSMLQRKLEQDERIKTEQLKKQKREAEIEEFRKIVRYQVEKEIIEPLKSLIEEFNAKYVGGEKIGIKINDKNECLIKLVSGKLLKLEIREIIDEEFYRMVEIEDYGSIRKKWQLERPLFRNRKIMAWGCLNNQYGKGFNMLLVEKEGEIYGEWFVLWNTNSSLNSNPRPQEPFAFDFTELEREIKNIDVMHIYNLNVEPLKIEHFVKFIDESI